VFGDLLGVWKAWSEPERALMVTAAIGVATMLVMWLL
jgi:hypothetical protein